MAPRRHHFHMGSEFSEALRSNAVMNLRQPLILYVPEGQLRVGERSGFDSDLIKKENENQKLQTVHF